jgi:hypothetical protein
MQIEYVTHASLLFRSPDVALLTDPFFRLERDPMLGPALRNYPPRILREGHFGRLDYVFSSHEHHDHCHPESLEEILEQVGTVLLPAGRPELVRRYTGLGYSRIRLLENRSWVRLEAGLEVMCAWDDPVDSFLVVRLDGCVAVHCNDCRPRPETLRALAGQMRVDYFFLCYTSVQDLFPLLLDRSETELTEWTRTRESAFFDAQCERIDALRPRVVVPYSYTPVYIQPEQFHLNGYGRMTPVTFRDRLSQCRPGVECLALQPGDVIETGTGTLSPLRSEDLWGEDLDAFLRNVRTFAEAVRSEIAPFDDGEAAPCEAELRTGLRRRLARGLPYAGLEAVLGCGLVLEVEGRDDRLVLQVDTASGDTRAVAAGTPAGLRITLPASLLRLMLDRRYDPLMVLYSYRVRFRLDPGLGSLSPVQEHGVLVGSFLSLFLDAGDPLWEEFAPFIAGLELPGRANGARAT